MWGGGGGGEALPPDPFILQNCVHDQTQGRAQDQTCLVMTVCAIQDRTAVVVVPSYRSVSRNPVCFKALVTLLSTSGAWIHAYSSGLTFIYPNN